MKKYCTCKEPSPYPSFGDKGYWCIMCNLNIKSPKSVKLSTIAKKAVRGKDGRFRKPNIFEFKYIKDDFRPENELYYYYQTKDGKSGRINFKERLDALEKRVKNLEENDEAQKTVNRTIDDWLKGLDEQIKELKKDYELHLKILD